MGGFEARPCGQGMASEVGLLRCDVPIRPAYRTMLRIAKNLGVAGHGRERSVEPEGHIGQTMCVRGWTRPGCSLQ